MKFYEYTRDENERTAKILGFPIIKQTSDYITAERHQSFFGGIITTIKINDLYSESSNKEIKFLGKSILCRKEKNNYRDYYIFNKKICSISLINEFGRKYLKYIKKDHDDIYILRANMGEIYLTLTYIINTLIEKNKSKKPLIVATRRYHIDLIKMICPNIPFVYIHNIRIKINQDEFKIKNFKFHLLYCHSHFKQVEIDIKENELGTHHYFKSILNRFDITAENIQMNKIILLLESSKNMQNKIKKLGLNLEKFVFIAPEAQSCKLYDEEFWGSLIKELKDKGYDVFVNLIANKNYLKNIVDFKTCDLSLSEAFALAKKAKRIVSLRSGFTEFLLQTETPIDVLYTKFRHRHLFDDMDIDHVISGFGITKIPYIDKSKIREFNTFEMSKEQIIGSILNGL